MKRATRLLLCAALAASSAVQVASAGVLFTNQVRNAKGMGLRIVYPDTYSRSYDKPGIRCYDRTAELNKLWIGWDLSAAWAFYGQSNLVDASFTYWGENGTSRSFWVAALDDSAGLDNWGQDTIEWTNAPGNIYYTSDPGTGPLRCAFDYTKCYGGTNIWEGGAGGVAVNLANPNFGGTVDQAARYTSTDPVINSNFTAWLKSDTDGLVTLMASGLNNQNWWVGTNGTYTNDVALGYVSTQPESLGEVCRDSPTLTLVFDVRVALIGGGTMCAGDPGFEISLSDTDMGYDYRLYTNGVYAATVSGTGSAESFGVWATEGDYTAVASNTTTTATFDVPSHASISVPPAPSFTAQPASFVGATNSIAIYTVEAVGAGGGYQWFRNGVALTDDGHYSGTTTEELIINPVLASDAATATDGYYCRIENLCGVAAFSTTNALTIQTARDLVWLGTPSNTWDIGTTANWSNTVSSALSVFNQGDNVTLDDNALDTSLTVADLHLAPGVITFNASGTMTIGGTGDISGPNSSLVVNGPTLSSILEIQNPNSFAGGTTINDGWLIIGKNESVGTGTITMAGTGLSVLEVQPKGGANVGIPGVNVIEDSIVQFDQGGGGGYAGAFLGPITGTAGKTLRVFMSGGTPGDNIRVWNDNFACDANINLDISSANFAPYNTGGFQTYNGVISGSGTLFTRVFGGGRLILNGANTYIGGTRFSAGTTGIGIDSVGTDSGVTSGALGTGAVTVEGNVGIFSSGGAHTVGNSVVYTASGGALTFTDTNVLTMSGSFDLGSGGISSAVDRTISADAGAKGVISGTISDTSGLGCGLVKDGDGTVLLNGVNTYSGTTTVSGGALGGTGTIAGSVVVDAGGSLAPGASVGTLTIGGDLTVNGNLAIDVDKSLSPGQSNDVVSLSGSFATAGGSIVVNNLGPALTVGDKFYPFGGAIVSDAGAMSVTGAGMTWANAIGTDGSITVTGVVPSASPTIGTISFSGGNLIITGTNGPTTGNYVVLGTNVITAPVSNWTRISTNPFNLDGTFAVTNSVLPGQPVQYYRIQLQ